MNPVSYLQNIANNTHSKESAFHILNHKAAKSKEAEAPKTQDRQNEKKKARCHTVSAFDPELVPEAESPPLPRYVSQENPDLDSDRIRHWNGRNR